MDLIHIEVWSPDGQMSFKAVPIRHYATQKLVIQGIKAPVKA